MESLNVGEHGEENADTLQEETEFLTCKGCGVADAGVLYSHMQDEILCDKCFNMLPVPQDVIDEATRVTKAAIDKWNRGIYTELDEAIEDRANRNPEIYRER